MMVTSGRVKGREGSRGIAKTTKWEVKQHHGAGRWVGSSRVGAPRHLCIRKRLLCIRKSDRILMKSDRIFRARAWQFLCASKIRSDMLEIRSEN